VSKEGRRGCGVALERFGGAVGVISAFQGPPPLAAWSGGGGCEALLAAVGRRVHESADPDLRPTHHIHFSRPAAVVERVLALPSLALRNEELVETPAVEPTSFYFLADGRERCTVLFLPPLSSHPPLSLSRHPPETKTRSKLGDTRCRGRSRSSWASASSRWSKL